MPSPQVHGRSFVSDLVLDNGASSKIRAKYVGNMLPSDAGEVSLSASGRSFSSGRDIPTRNMSLASVLISIPQQCTNLGDDLPVSGLPVLMSSVVPTSTFVNSNSGHIAAPSRFIGKAGLAEVCDDEHVKKAQGMRHPNGFSSQSVGSMLQGDQGKSVGYSYEQQKRITNQMHRNLHASRVQILKATVQTLKANAAVPVSADVGPAKNYMV